MRADRPKGLEDLRGLLREAPQAPLLLAGGTDLVPWLRRRPAEDPHLVDISRLEELRGLRSEGSVLEIGAATTFGELEASALVRRDARVLAEASSQVGSPQVRNRGTLGGNVAHASVAADGIPALCCLDARGVVEDPEGRREELPVEHLVLGAGETRVGPRRYLRCFRIPLTERPYGDFAKVGSRTTVTISKLSLALSGGLEDRGLRSPRLFVGAVAPTPVRVPEAEAVLAEGGGTDAAKKAFLDALTARIDELIPERPSRPYKRMAVRGLWEDLWTRLREALR